MANDPDTLPTFDDLTGKCPRCARHSNFEVVDHQVLRFKHEGKVSFANAMQPARKGESILEQVTVLRCMGCNRKSVVIEARVDGDMTGVLWWPSEHLADLEPGQGVPTDIIASYSEGVRCLAVSAPNAAAAMFRTTIAQLVMDKGSAEAKSKPTLFAKINQMAADGALWNGFGEAAHHVRKLGNAGATPGVPAGVDRVRLHPAASDSDRPGRHQAQATRRRLLDQCGFAG